MTIKITGITFTEDQVRVELIKLRQSLDRQKTNGKLPNREEEYWWLTAERFFPQLLVELFPDWIVKPASASFCLVKEPRF